MTKWSEPMIGDYLVVVSIRGKDSESLNLTASGHSRIGDDEIFSGDSEDSRDERIKWYNKNKFKSVQFKITQSLDVFNHEVQYRDLTYFTGVHESN